MQIKSKLEGDWKGPFMHNKKLNFFPNRQTEVTFDSLLTRTPPHPAKRVKDNKWESNKWIFCKYIPVLGHNALTAISPLNSSAIPSTHIDIPYLAMV